MKELLIIFGACVLLYIGYWLVHYFNQPKYVKEKDVYGNDVMVRIK